MRDVMVAPAAIGVVMCAACPLTAASKPGPVPTQRLSADVVGTQSSGCRLEPFDQLVRDAARPG